MLVANRWFEVHTYEQALPSILVQTNWVLHDRTSFIATWWPHQLSPLHIYCFRWSHTCSNKYPQRNPSFPAALAFKSRLFMSILSFCGWWPNSLFWIWALKICALRSPSVQDFVAGRSSFSPYHPISLILFFTTRSAKRWHAPIWLVTVAQSLHGDLLRNALWYRPLLAPV